jgi:hypothetical protein
MMAHYGIMLEKFKVSLEQLAQLALQELVVLEDQVELLVLQVQAE